MKVFWIYTELIYKCLDTLKNKQVNMRISDQREATEIILFLTSQGQQLTQTTSNCNGVIF